MKKNVDLKKWVQGLLTQEEWSAVSQNKRGRATQQWLPIRVEDLKSAAVNETTGGVFRIHMADVSSSSQNSWSCILKRLVRPEESRSHWRRDSYNYWLAEAEAYSCLAPNGKVKGLRTPHCYFQKRVSSSEMVLLLEDLGPSKQKTVQQWRRIARDVARFNLHTVVHGESLRYLPKSALRMLRDVRMIISDPVLWNHRIVKTVFSKSMRSKFQAVLKAQPLWHELFERMPRCLSHMDLQASNLFFDSRGQTVAIDWSGFSKAPLGADLGQWVAGNVFSRATSLAQFHGLMRQVEKAYLQTLSRESSDISAPSVQLTIRATAALRLTYSVPFYLQMLTDRKGLRIMEHAMGGRWSSWAASWGEGLAWGLSLADPYLTHKL